MRLTDRIYLIGGGAYGYSASGDCNMYLIECGGALAMVDSGGGGGTPRVLDNIRRMKLDPKKVKMTFVTHCHYDHIGGNYNLKRATGCKIAAHESEVKEIETLGELTLYDMASDEGLEFKPTKVDTPLRDGQRVEVGDVEFTVIHTPGHTPGGICLLFREVDSVNLFTGDTASAQGRLGWVNGPGCDIYDWKRSIKRLLELKPDRMFPGHGVFVLSGAADQLKLLDVQMNTPWTNITTSSG